jgi:hypothetical protein
VVVSPVENGPRRVELMVQSLYQAREWLAFVAIAVATAGICVSFRQSDKTQVEGGWRRTSAGWEKVAVGAGSASATQRSPAFHTTNMASNMASRNEQRWDTHPAVLAVLQLAAVLALFAMPMGWRTGSSGAGRVLARFPRLVANSFRASAFY